MEGTAASGSQRSAALLPAVYTWRDWEAGPASEKGTKNEDSPSETRANAGVFPMSSHNLIKTGLFISQVLLDYQERAVDLSEDFTVAASNVITTLAFGKEVGLFQQLFVWNSRVLKTVYKMYFNEQLWFCQTRNWLLVCVGERAKSLFKFLFLEARVT